MATWDDVRRLALALPQTAEGTSRESLLGWSVNGKTFAWERPLRRGDLQALGDAALKGPVLAARVPDLGAKEALLATGGEVYFTTPHFNGYPAILVRLDREVNGVSTHLESLDECQCSNGRAHVAGRCSVFGA
jgi:hypothetical protein